MTRVTYSSNNSGGSWWLTDEDWYALENAGWEVDWAKNRTDGFMRGNAEGRWLGALATKASREGLSLGDAIEEWESITGERANDLGCSCCGTPHRFSTDEGDYYSPSYPSYGERDW